MLNGLPPKKYLTVADCLHNPYYPWSTGDYGSLSTANSVNYFVAGKVEIDFKIFNYQ